MIYELDNDIVTIEIPENITKIGIMLSGGLDSAILTYLLCKEIFETNRNIKIKPFTWKRPYPVDNPQQWNVEKAQMIIKFLRSVYPGIIEDQYVFEPIYSQKRLSSEVEKSEWVRLSEIGRSEYNVDHFFYGTTANPPYEEMTKYGMLEGRQESRDKENLKTIDDKKHNPFINLDKKGIAQLYHKLNLIDTLFPLTWSCEGWANSNNNFTTPCQECWWCKEKYWGFGKY